MSDGEVVEIQNDDSDCEILPESELSVVEVTDSQDEEVSNSDDTEDEANSQDEEHIGEDNSQENDESQENQSQEDQTQENIRTSNNHETLFRMCFNNEENFMKLKDCIKEAIHLCLRQNGINIDFVEDKNFLDICVFEKTDSSTEDVENEIIVNTPNEQEVVDSTVADLCFQIDTTPQANLDKRTIPCYKRSVKDVLEENNKRKKIDLNECTRPKGNACFNCFGDHSLKDCPKPKNQQRINKNRRAHAVRGERYHIEGRQRFDHLKPGRISDNLKKALGLRNGELPPFVYKMRLLGYPPGWLEEAKIPHSGLALFDSEGRKVMESDEEDGEVDITKYKYDIEKIISFPGYNVDPGPNYFDDYRYHGVPPMLPKFKKEAFIKSLGDDNILRAYKRKKLKDLSANSNFPKNIIEDMEIENVDDEVTQITNSAPFPPPPLPSEPAPSTPPPPPERGIEIENVDNEMTQIIKPNLHLPPSLPSEPGPLTPPQTEDDRQSSSIDARDSPSLDELEERQKQLLEALQNSASILDTSTEDAQLDDEEKGETAIEENSQESELKTITNSENSSIIEIIGSSQSNDASISSASLTPVTLSQTSSTTSQTSKTFMLGTPILKFSPYDKLPSGEKFSVGISDVINFENLADSTGKYEQMKKVLHKIRNVVTQLNMND